MSEQLYTKLTARITDNPLLREPQIEAYDHIASYFNNPANTNREVGVVLPVGCGKSGLITLVPFALKSKKVLVVAPGTDIAGQLLKDFSPSNDEMFYKKAKVLDVVGTYPEAAEIRGSSSNKPDLDAADVVITNIQQLSGSANKWLDQLPDNYFDLIMFDEGHHNVAESWQLLRRKFPEAKILNASATPTRADGRLMEGAIIYSYPVARATQKGYVKHLKAIQLNPKTLQYVENKGGQEVTLSLDEVKQLAKTDAIFRRSVVSSKKSLDTIVDASIRELRRLRKETGDDRLKIIASALNYDHCKQIVAAYRERELRADFVHTREDSKANKQIMAKLERHELDVIVQVRKLGEGFDHKYLSVAAVFSIFANLSPFVQFVGRIMRVIKQDSPGDKLNVGTVVYHAGANTATAWGDFQDFATKDQEWFKLLTEQQIIDDTPEVLIDPTEEMERSRGERPLADVVGQSEVVLEEVPLLKADVREALEVLRANGLPDQDVSAIAQKLEPVHVSAQNRRRASRKELDELVRNQTGKTLAALGKSAEGKDLDARHLGKTNLQVIKSALDNKLNALVDNIPREQLSQPQIDIMKASLGSVALEVERELSYASA